MSRQIRCSLILLTTAAIWGLAYVAQKLALGSVGPLTLNTLRGMLAWMFLIPCRFFLNRYNERTGKEKKEFDWKTTIRGGIVCGLFLCGGSVCQAYGLRGAEVGKAGFLTTLYIVMVPVLGMIIGKKCGKKVWFSVALALVGTYLLCVKEDFSINGHDIWLLICALFFAGNIVFISTVCDRVDNVIMSTIQFFACSGVTLIPAIILEHNSLEQIIQAMPVIAYSGIFSCGIGYTIEIIGQDGLDPTVSSLLLSFESIFSLLAGWLLLHEVLSQQELLGCAIVVFAAIFAQLPERKLLGKEAG